MSEQANPSPSPASDSQARIEVAVQRIEDALVRISHYADTLRPAPPSVSALVVDHENLREKTGKAIEDIDALIAALQESAR